MTGSLELQLREHVTTVTESRALLPLVEQISDEICARLAQGGTVYAFGNGGSAADAQHLVAEFIGHYSRDRRPLAAVSLTTDPSVTTCIANDYSYEDVFARQVSALAGPDDVVIAFSTSGRSPTVVSGLAAARQAGALTVLFTGAVLAEAAAHADRVLSVPSKATARIQEGHVLLLHLLSELVDQWAAALDNPTQENTP
jgi:D-sedoheptulose 7-phosphate isomerase